MATRMKDDERRLLGAAQAAGKLVPVAEMTEQRFNGLRKKWLMLNLVNANDTLTHKGMGASGGTVPHVKMPAMPELVAPNIVEDAVEIEDPTDCEPEESDDEPDDT